MLTEENQVLLQLRKICKQGSLLEFITSIDSERDNTQIEKQRIAIPTNEFVESTLSQLYQSSGLAIREHRFFKSSKSKKSHESERDNAPISTRQN